MQTHSEVNTYRKAPFWKRAVAGMIDSFFLALIAVVLGFLAITLSVYYSFSTNIAIVLSVLGVVFLYEPILLYTRGATLGKMLLHIWVVADHGHKLSLGKVVTRSVLKVFSSFFNLGYLWVLIDPKRQSWHDKIAGTYVITVDRDNTPIKGYTPPVSSLDKVVFAVLLVISIVTTVSRASEMAIRRQARSERLEELQQQMQQKNIKVYTPVPKQRN